MKRTLLALLNIASARKTNISTAKNLGSVGGQYYDKNGDLIEITTTYYKGRYGLTYSTKTSNRVKSRVTGGSSASFSDYYIG